MRCASKQLVVLLEKPHLLPHLRLNVASWRGPFSLRGHVVRRGVDGDVVQNALRHAGDGVDLGDAVDLVAEKFDADGPARPVGG